MFNALSGLPTTPQDGNEKNFDMKSRLIWWFIMQGLGVVVLGIWNYVQYKEIQDLKAENKQLHVEIKESLKAQNEQMVLSIKDLTTALNKLK